MQFYKCYILEDGWCIVTENYVEYMWAHSYEEARDLYCKQFHFRKNKKGMRIEEHPYRIAKRILKKEGRWVKYTHYERAALNNLVEDEVYKTVIVAYCSECGREVSRHTQYCKCGAELKDYAED